MAKRSFLIKSKPGILHLVIADKAEIQDENLVFLDSEGKLVALFLMEVVESWSEVSH
jgi:hypothetical protein